MSTLFQLFDLGFIRSSTMPVVRWTGLLVSISLGPSLIFTCDTSEVRAGSPSLAFDFGSTAECQVVSSRVSDDPNRDLQSVRQLDASQKLIELKLRVSVHLLAGKISDVEEVRIEIGDCDGRIRVESFAPNTRLESPLSDDIQ